MFIIAFLITTWFFWKKPGPYELMAGVSAAWVNSWLFGVWCIQLVGGMLVNLLRDKCHQPDLLYLKTWASCEVYRTPNLSKETMNTFHLFFHAVWLIAISFHGVWGGLPFALHKSDDSAWKSCTLKTVDDLFIVSMPSELYRVGRSPTAVA